MILWWNIADDDVSLCINFGNKNASPSEVGKDLASQKVKMRSKEYSDNEQEIPLKSFPKKPIKKLNASQEKEENNEEYNVEIESDIEELPSSDEETSTFKASYGIELISKVCKNRLLKVLWQSPKPAEYWSSVNSILNPAVFSVFRGVYGRNFKLFKHQGEALHALKRNQNVVVCTSTASGKSLVYIARALELLHDHVSRFGDSTTAEPPITFLVFPTKALSQDQFAALSKVRSQLPPDLQSVFRPYLLDGDVANTGRVAAQKEATIVLTNPDMIHATILLHRSKFSRLLSRLRLLVVDEAHSYRGAFGGHVAMVMRRLMRANETLRGMNAYLPGGGAVRSDVSTESPQVVLCTATVANPIELFENLMGLSRENLIVVDRDFAPRGRRALCLWSSGGNGVQVLHDLGNDDVVKVEGSEDEEGVKEAKRRRIMGKSISSLDRAGAELLDAEIDREMKEGESDGRIFNLFDPKDKQEGDDKVSDAPKSGGPSPFRDTAKAVATLAANCVRSIAFCPGRSSTELVTSQSMKCLNLLRKKGLTDIPKGDIVSYRAGYPVAVRRQIEHDIFSGTALGVVSTNALELGIDVGTLDVAFTVGFPGTVAGLFQQMGRAGRGNRQGVCVLVETRSPLDFLFSKHPEELFSRKPECATIDPCNPFVLRQHLACCVHEGPHVSTAEAVARFGEGARDILSTLEQQMIIKRQVVSDTRLAERQVQRRRMQEKKVRDKQEKRAVNARVDEFRTVKEYMADGTIRELFVAADEFVELDNASSSEDNSNSDSEEQNSIPTEHDAREREIMWMTAASSPFHSSVSLRSIDSRKVQVFRSGAGMDATPLDEIEYHVAIYIVYPGATYTYRNQEFIVQSLDVEQLKAFIDPAPPNLRFYTKSRDLLRISILQQWSNLPRFVSPLPPMMRSIGSEDCPEVEGDKVLIETGVGKVLWEAISIGYAKFSRKSDSFMSNVDHELPPPPVKFVTVGVWVTFAACLKTIISAEAVHAVSHLMLTVLPLFVVCDPQDIMCNCIDARDIQGKYDFMSAVFDKRPGGVGVCDRAHQFMPEILKLAYRLVLECDCENGCERCILHSNCASFNDALDKKGAELLLRCAVWSFSQIGRKPPFVGIPPEVMQAWNTVPINRGVVGTVLTEEEIEEAVRAKKMTEVSDCMRMVDAEKQDLQRREERRKRREAAALLIANGGESSNHERLKNKRENQTKNESVKKESGIFPIEIEDSNIIDLD